MENPKVLKISHTYTYNVRSTEYINLPSRCSVETYYESQARLYEELNIEQIPNFNNQTYQDKKCPFKEKCVPISLPINGKLFPPCNDAIDRGCYTDVFKTLFTDIFGTPHKDLEHRQKTCHVREFKTELLWDSGPILPESNKNYSIILRYTHFFITLNLRGQSKSFKRHIWTKASTYQSFKAKTPYKRDHTM